MLLNNSEYATVGGDVQSTFIDYPGVAPASISVIARNSRGAGPAATDDRGPLRTAQPGDRPGAGGRGPLAAGIVGPASSPGSSIANYDYRVDGGQGGSTSGTGPRQRCPDRTGTTLSDRGARV